MEDRPMTAPASPQTQWTYLEPNPKSAYKQLFVKGTRIRARILYGEAMSEQEPQTAEQIAANYGLSVEAVKEAIAYCKSSPPEIEDDFQREEALMEATGMNEPDYKSHGKPKVLSAREIARIEGQ
jgi:uncharacterized protein (DUF433 family)